MKPAIHSKIWCLGVFVAAATIWASAQSRDAHLFLFASDRDGKPVTDVAATDITVRQAAVEVPVLELRRGMGRIRLVILVDTSDAAMASLPTIKQRLVTLVTRAPQDTTAALVTVGGTPHLGELTADRSQIRRQIGSLYGEIGAGTQVARAVIESDARFFRDTDTWPVLVVIASDAAENTAGIKQPDFDATEAHLLAVGATVHAVVLTGSANNSGGAKVLHAMTHNLCDMTKGLCVEASSNRAVEDALSQIAERLVSDAERAALGYELRYQGANPAEGAAVQVGTSRAGVSLSPSVLRVP